MMGGSSETRPVLVTGGAGFIGCNVSHRLASQGRRVLVLDNLSRPGVARNARWLTDTHADLVEVRRADVRDAAAVTHAVSQASAVYHFAAQVAVTTSLEDPIEDFEVNARGTLNVLEAIRRAPHAPPLLFTSTNKVYGDLEDIALRQEATRYVPVDESIAAHGVDEGRPLCFHSPYGCSKGAADQYVLDYARSFGLRAVVFRMSCIYGPRQFGTEDQGWLAHFMIRALRGEAITLYGDGLQVRDVLFVDDLVQAMTTAMSQIDAVSGRAFNVGGGAGNTTSLRELLHRIETLVDHAPRVELQPWRTGDQRYYVSNVEALRSAIGWQPKTSVGEGTSRLLAWLRELPQDGPRSMPASLAVGAST